MEIPYLSLQRITAMHGAEISNAVQRVVDSGWYLQGKEISAFEDEYAAYCHATHCITCANGLDALTLTLRSLKEMGCLADGDEVIVPANTYIATILAITENNLKPVLIEPRTTNFQIDDSRIASALTPKTKAIMLVNLYGFDAYTDEIGRICRDNKLMLIIDNAQGHGLPLPQCATAVCHSFYPGKNLGALGDAGAVTTNDDTLATTLRAVCNYGSSKKYVFDYQGRNSRMDEVQAAVLRVKLKYLNDDNQRRIEVAKALIMGITSKDIVLPPAVGVFHIFPILVNNRDALQQYLRDKGIQTMIHYPIPPHQQHAYKVWNALSFPITEDIHRRELSLPCNPAMTDAEVEYIIRCINEWQ